MDEELVHRQGLFFILLILSVFSAHSSEPLINVRIAKAMPHITVRGIDLKREVHTKGNSDKLYEGKKIIKFNCKRNLNLARKKSKPVLVASLSTMSGIIDWNDKKYRGKFHLLTSAEQDSCDLVNELSLEAYISSLLSAEMRNDWPIEALKAQAVAARTYALHKIETKQVSNLLGYESYFDLENSEKHQVNGSLLDESHLTQLAARQTRGGVLKSKNGKLTPIFFHSKCGGRTILPRKVWENRVDGYQSVDCPYCDSHGMKPWNTFVDEKSFKKALNEVYVDVMAKDVIFSDKELGRPITIIPDQDTKTFVRFYNKGNMYKVKKSHLRKILGRKTLPSNNFEIHYDSKGYRFLGRGYGHGVGLCQFGAYELAKRGMNYKQILSHYFPGHKLEKIY